MMIELVKSNHTIISGDELEELLHLKLGRVEGPSIVDFFKTHPLLTLTGEGGKELFTLRFHFFEDHFTNIYLGMFLRGEVEASLFILECLSARIAFDSAFTGNCDKRMSQIAEDKSLQFLELLHKIQELPCEDEALKKRAISGLFLIGLRGLLNAGNYGKEDVTQFLKDVFEVRGEIRNFHLFNLTKVNYGKNKALFDFRGMKLVGCTISNFDLFWDCDFDSETSFTACEFEQLPDHYVKSDASMENFKECKFDVVSQRSKPREEGAIESAKASMINDFKAFLKVFYKGGQMHSRKASSIRKAYDQESAGSRTINANEMITLLSGLLLMANPSTRKGDKSYQIIREHQESAIKYFSQGLPSDVTTEAINRLFNKYELTMMSRS